MSHGKKSTHLSEVAGDIETVTGELIVDTGLRDIQSMTVSFAHNNFLPDEEAHVTWFFSDLPSRRKVTIRVETGGVNDGNLGTNPTLISWVAFGR